MSHVCENMVTPTENLIVHTQQIIRMNSKLILQKATKTWEEREKKRGGDKEELQK